MSLFDVIRAGKVNIWNLDFDDFPESVMDKWKYRLLMYQWDNVNRLVNADPESKGAELAQYVVDTFNLYIDNAIKKIEFEDKVANTWGEWADKINMSDELILDQANCAVFLSVMINEHMDVPDVLYYALRYKDSVDRLEEDANVTGSRLEKMYENWFIEELLKYEEDDDTMVRAGTVDIWEMEEMLEFIPEDVIQAWQRRIEAHQWDIVHELIAKNPKSTGAVLANKIFDAFCQYISRDISYDDYQEIKEKCISSSSKFATESTDGRLLMLAWKASETSDCILSGLDDSVYVEAMVQDATNFKALTFPSDGVDNFNRATKFYENWLIEMLTEHYYKGLS